MLFFFYSDNTSNMSERISLLCFLGNPGKQYAATRHNAAWMLLNAFEQENPLTWQQKFKGKFAKHQVPGKNAVYFYTPHTFMNKSGEGVREISAFFSIPEKEILVVYDELDLVPGTWKIRRGGGLKGHNGLRSVQQHLGDNNFVRIAIGIGRPDHPSFPVQKWVLSTFRDEEKADLFRGFDDLISLLGSIADLSEMTIPGG